MKFSGSMVALITPFHEGQLDEKSFCDLVEWQIAEGTEGLVPCGTTGESPTLSHDEHRRIVELCIKVADGRVPVIAGSGSNSTQEAIELSRHAQVNGADACLVVTPYYNKPNQEGLTQHFRAIHDATDIPIFIYNIPPRSVIDMSIETMAELAKLPRIIGVKDATADLGRPLRQSIACPAGFIQLSGEDITALPFLAQGGVGCISVSANVAPRQCAAMHNAWRNHDIDTACQINRQLAPLHDAMFCQPSPAPAKYGASLLSRCRPETRLPITGLSEEMQKHVANAVQQLGLLTRG